MQPNRIPQIVKFLRAYFVAALIGSFVATLGFWWFETTSLFTYPHHPPSWIGYVWRGLFIGTLAGVTISAIAMPIIAVALFVVRRLRIWRPFADVVAGVIFATLQQYKWLTARIDLAKRDPVPMSYDSIYQIAAGMIIGGALAGLTYWLLAGRPRPPYTGNQVVV